MIAFALELAACSLAPARCAACDDPVRILRAFCTSCALTIAPGIDRQNGRAAFTYDGALARAIVRLKYERRPDLARALGDLLWRALEPKHAALAHAVVVPVPLHSDRLVRRGFNQSLLLAQRVARGLRVPLWPSALRRLRDTPQQATLDRRQRMANVRHAFEARQSDELRGRRVLLIDDVRTTGATLDACALALKVAGAADIYWGVVAQAEVDTHPVT